MALRSVRNVLIGVGVVATAIAIACGGGTVDGTGSSSGGTSGGSNGGTSGATSGGTSGSSGTSGTSGGTSGSSSGTSETCPSKIPAGPCGRNGLECEYGGDPRPHCRTHAECTDGTWVVSAATCTPLPTVTCPATQAEASGKTCTTTGAFCEYSGVVCECTNCTKYPVERCEGPITWRCEEPPAGAGCPPGRPRLGNTCTTEGQRCVYGCEPDQSRECKSGNWVSYSSPGGCPVSTREAKTNIHYLSEAEIDDLASSTRSLKLASWRYAGKLDDGRTHVGYILEDAPGSPASNMSRREIDLYSYASLTLALAQRQQREIDELKRELHELKSRKR